MRFSGFLALIAAPVISFAGGQSSSKPPAATLPSAGTHLAASNLTEVRRIYVEPLSGNPTSQALRDLIIAGLDSTKLFVITEDADRADAILKGAADDKAFVDSFDTDSSLTNRAGGGIYGLTGKSTRSSGGYGAESASEHESHKIRERKHEAYAAVRLCNRAGDVIWSTTQESEGAKFRGASADVAVKIARQLTLDFDAARHRADTAVR